MTSLDLDLHPEARRAVLRYERAVRQHRRERNEQSYARVRQAHEQLVLARRDALLASWGDDDVPLEPRSTRPRCSRCDERLRPAPTGRGTRRAWRCNGCGFGLALIA